MLKRVPFQPGVNGWHSFDDDKVWFDPGDPFSNHLELVTAECGDDIVATMFYAGVPVLNITAGPSLHEDEQYFVSEPTYYSRDLIFIQVMFHENVVGDMALSPAQEDADVESYSVRVITEGLTMDSIYDAIAAEGDQGYEWVAFAGRVAEAMYAANSEVLSEPKGW